MPPSRRGRVNVRTGCLVCKVRHLKCDEDKPKCAKCVKAGWKCHYDDQLAPAAPRGRPPKFPEATESQALNLYTPSAATTQNVDEQRSLQYFRAHTVQDISSCFESEFWDYLVLQASYRDPAIRHALLALGSLYEAVEYERIYQRGPKDNEVAPPMKFALQQYTKAVGILANTMSSSDPPLQNILIACVIFVWIEFIQNNIDVGLNHLQSGLKILKDLQATARLSHIDASVPRLFIRLHSQAKFHGSTGYNFNAVASSSQLDLSLEVPPAFPSIFEARNCLDKQCDAIYRMLRKLRDPQYMKSIMTHPPHPDPQSFETLLNMHVNSLHKWKVAFDSIPALRTLSPESKQSAGFHLLLLQYTMLFIILQTLPIDNSEMVYDNYHTHFEAILSHAEVLINGKRNHTQNYFVLSFDIGVLAPLALTTIKCRNFHIRRRAMDLMRLGPTREGIWNRDLLLEYSEWKFEREERGRGDLPLTAPLPEEARIWAEQAREGVVDGKTVTILKFKMGQRQPDGNEKIIEEITDLSAVMGDII